MANPRREVVLPFHGPCAGFYHLDLRTSCRARKWPHGRRPPMNWPDNALTTVIFCMSAARTISTVIGLGVFV